jgi:adenylate cyclase class IV
MWKEEKAAIKDEHETKISNVESFQKVLQKYGMEKTREKIKHRVSFKLAWAEFDIDTYDKIPAFLEIEEESRENINFWLRKLWLNDHTVLIGWSRSVFKHYWVEYLNFDWKNEAAKKEK